MEQDTSWVLVIILGVMAIVLIGMIGYLKGWFESRMKGGGKGDE